jgi:DNA-binding NarL/FixJ family response regulator
MLDLMVHLTPREKQILHFVAEEGLSLPQAAQHMGIAPATIRVYVHKLYRKLEFPKQQGHHQGLVRMTIWYWKRRESDTYGLGQS